MQKVFGSFIVEIFLLSPLRFRGFFKIKGNRRPKCVFFGRGVRNFAHFGEESSLYNKKGLPVKGKKVRKKCGIKLPEKEKSQYGQAPLVGFERFDTSQRVEAIHPIEVCDSCLK